MLSKLLIRSNSLRRGLPLTRNFGANIKVIGLNPLIEKSPETINDKPYETWICEITLDSDVEIDNLLNYEHYLDLIKE